MEHRKDWVEVGEEEHSYSLLVRHRMVLHKLSVRCRLALVEEGTGPGCRKGEARCWADTVMVRRVGLPVSPGRRGYRELLHHNWYKTLPHLEVAHHMFYTA